MSFFNLTARAISQESSYLSKERRIPRTEFAPHIQLIRSSEVAPFGPSAPGASINPSPNPPNPGAPRTTLTSSTTSPLPPTSSTPQSTHTSTPRQQKILHPAANATLPSFPSPSPPPKTLSSATNEPLKAAYRTAITNLQNEVQAAKQQTKRARAELVLAARQLARARRWEWASTVVFAGMAGFMWFDLYRREKREEIWRKIVGERERKVESGVGERGMNRMREEERGVGKGRKEGIKQQETEGGWRDWFWARGR